MAPWEIIEDKLKQILDQGLMNDNYIFNLGHGISRSSTIYITT